MEKEKRTLNPFSKNVGNQTMNLQLTPDNSKLLGKSKKVRVIKCLKQITGNKKLSKWMVSECN